MFTADPFSIWWFKATCYALFASFGGTMGYLLRNLDEGKSINWLRGALEGLAAGFVGLLVMLACQAMVLSESWTGVIVGVSGWLGASTTIKMLEGMVRKKLGVSDDDKPA